MLAVVVTYLIADSVSGPLMAADPSGVVTEVPLAGGIIGTVLGGIVGALLALGTRNLERNVTVFVGICAAALVLYGIYAIAQADNAATAVWLNVMHVAAAIPIVGMLVRWMQARAAEPAVA